jgi:3'5'-cyclic nucleotide phosphodiesterase
MPLCCNCIQRFLTLIYTFQVKLLTRIVAPDKIDYDDMCYKNMAMSDMHDHTYGITSDPLTQFACAFSALIHDVDHTGLPNAQLVKTGNELALLYGNKSVAEQNSVDLAWDLLMEPAYDDLRRCIYSTQEELDRFRQLVVNSVMATDIVDKELGAARKKRWEKAFAPKNCEMESAPDAGESSSRDAINRKATIVIEHLIQASDVAHTMQHWQ